MASVEPMSGTLGAVMRGVDLSSSLSDDLVAEIWNAFLEHHVLYFPDQDLTPDAQVRFGRHFGELDTHPFVEGMEAHPEVIEIVTEADDRVNFGGGWHSDVTFLEQPDLGSILFAVDVPPFGGDTLFANQHAAYDALSDTMKDMLDGLVAKHSAGPQYAQGGYSTLSRSMKTKPAEGIDTIVRHPPGAHAPRDREEGALRQPCLHRRHRGDAPRRSAGTTRVPLRPRCQRAFHLQDPLDVRVSRHVGQPQRPALCALRLPRTPPPHATRHGQG